jgi:flagellar hook-basal body complex protein FliE
MTDPLGLINNQVAGPTNVPKAPQAPKGAEAADGPDFKDVLMENIRQVNKLQQDAEMAIEDLQTRRRTDVGNVIAAKQKADMAFNMLLQVRNKLVDAYEEIKQMRV